MTDGQTAGDGGGTNHCTDGGAARPGPAAPRSSQQPGPQQLGSQQPGPQPHGPLPHGPAPAGLTGQLPHPPPRPVLGVAAAVLLALGAAAALWAAFVGVGPATVDGAVLAESVEVRSGGLTAAATLLTEVGSTLAMALLAVVVGIWLWTRGRRADAVLVVGAMAGASLLFRALKVLFDRPRPPVASRLVSETNESLPSGHATMSVVVIGSLVVLAWAGRGTAARMVTLAAAALWVGAVGATRVYLGVHWFSDVVAGWLVGAAWLAVCVALWSWWRRSRLQRTGGAMAARP